MFKDGTYKYTASNKGGPSLLARIDPVFLTNEIPSLNV
jgi:hypothetical protein